MRTCLLVALLALCGCGEEIRPAYDDALGFEAIPAEEGSLAGTFALRATSASLVIVPVLGEYLGGGVNYRLLTRTWDADAGVYHQTSKLCGGFNFEVAGVVTAADQPTYRAVPDSTEELVTVDHARGTFETINHVQLWGINLPEPLDSEMPSDIAEANTPPHSERIYDMDADGNIGFTLHVSGAVDGEVYAIQRKRVTSQRGLILGADLVRGVLETTYETIRLGNNNALLDRASEGDSEPYPDPLESWFEEVRVDPAITCDEVVELDATGELSRVRPF